MSKTTIIRNLISVFFFIIFFFSSSSINVQGYFYQTDLQVGETLVYQRRDYNFTTQSWSPWFYLMFEITSIEDTQVELAETIIKAVQWVSNDTIHWKQMPFLTSTIGQIQDNYLTETGTISRLQEIPIHRFSGFQNEDVVIRSDIKIGEMISNIETKINNSLDEEDWLIVESINEGLGLKITVSECGCSIEGGTSRRVRNITYSPSGILNNYYFSQRVDYGPDAISNQQEFEVILLQEFSFDGVVFENLSSNWKEINSQSVLKPNVIQFYGISLAFAVIFIIFWRRKHQ